MDQQLLNHLLALAAKTGDRLIIVDPATQKPFVLMGIAQYEALRGTTPERAPAPAPVTPIVTSTMTSVAAAVAMEDDGPFLPVDLGMMARRAEARVEASRYTPEPPIAALPDDERFYVEPLE